jgi:hypothetical protein
MSDVDPDRQHDVVDKHLAGLVGTPQRGQHRAPQLANRGVVDASAGLVVQIANSRRVGIVSDRIQRRARQIENQSVTRLAKENDGIAFQVLDRRLTGPEVGHRCLLTIFPIFTIGIIAEVQTDAERVFPLQ